MSEWNAGLYESRHSFVWEYGRELIAILEPRPGERILDVGCGTGRLTAELARAGSKVLGVDSSVAMIEQARKNFANIEFMVADVRALPFHGQFDALLSNAALHWVKEAERAAAAISEALKPGGRFVAEFGAHGNIRRIMEAIFAALESVGAGRVQPWYFPMIGEYASLLEQAGLEVRYARLFDRPTPLALGESGLANWMEMFGRQFLESIDPARKGEFIRAAEEHARPALFRDGQWTADYRRLRVLAVKV